jgi:tetratricopeptide (TPR) repeat protein
MASRVGDANPHVALIPAQEEKALRAEQLQMAEKLVSVFPDSDDAMYLLGLVHNEQGNSEAAMKFWERSLSMDATRADANDSLGQACLLRDEYERAEGYFRKALAIDPTLSTANFRLASALVHQGKMQEAVMILEKAHSLSTEGHRLLGEAYQSLKDFRKAKASYQEALKLNPHSAEAHYGLSRVCAQLGEAERSSEHFETFSALKKKSEEEARRVRDNYDTLAITRKSLAQTHTDVGRVYMTEGRAREAEESWMTASRLDPRNTLCRLQLAVLYQQTNRTREALKFYEEVARIDPADALVQLNMARVCVKLNEIERAERAFKEVIRLAGHQAEAHSSLAELYLRTRRNLPEAVQLAEMAVKIAPEAQYYALLAQAYAMNGNRAGALEAFNRAIELRPDNPQYVQMREKLLQSQ